MTTIEPRHLIELEIRDLRAITAGLSDTDLTKSTACAGWRVADLITHLRLGMDGILQGLASATDKPADRRHFVLERLSLNWTSRILRSALDLGSIRFVCKCERASVPFRGFRGRRASSLCSVAQRPHHFPVARDDD